MSIKNKYLAGLMERVIKRNPNEPEFHQAVEEMLETLDNVADRHPEYIEKGVFDMIVEPERIIKFRVPWMDDNGNIQVNRSSLTVQSALTKAACVFTPRFTKE